MFTIVLSNGILVHKTYILSQTKKGVYGFRSDREKKVTISKTKNNSAIYFLWKINLTKVKIKLIFYVLTRWAYYFYTCTILVMGFCWFYIWFSIFRYILQGKLSYSINLPNNNDNFWWSDKMALLFLYMYNSFNRLLLVLFMIFDIFLHKANFHIQYPPPPK